MAKTIVGSFDNFEEAQEVFRDLKQSGFAQDDISIIGNNASGRVRSSTIDLPPDAPATMSDTGSGAATGGVLGGAAGLVVGLMGLAIPGIGPIVAAGPLAAALAGAGVGAVAGGLIGGLGGFIAGTAVDYLGYAFMIGFIIWMILNERNILKRHLREEVEKGYLSQRQYNSALSFFQANAYLSALTSGSFLKTARFYQVCGELAHKKEQLNRLGEERGNTRLIERLRTELVALAPAAKA